MTSTTTDPMFVTLVGAILTHNEAGDHAEASLRLRLKSLAYHYAPRAQIEFDTDGEPKIQINSQGLPYVSVRFGCDGYNEPVNGTPDPRAITDFKDAIANVNVDGKLTMGPIGLLTPYSDS